MEYYSSLNTFLNEGGPRDKTSTYFDYHQNDPLNSNDYQDKLKIWKPEKNSMYKEFKSYFDEKYLDSPTANTTELPWLQDENGMVDSYKIPDGKNQDDFEKWALLYTRQIIQKEVKFNKSMVTKLKKWFDDNFEHLWIPKAKHNQVKARFERTLPLIKTTLDVLYVCDKVAREGRNNDDRKFFKEILSSYHYKVWRASTNAEYHLSWSSLMNKLYAMM